MSRSTLTSYLYAALMLSAAPPTLVLAAEPAGHVTCTITENGQPASGVISIQKDGNEIATASCGRELAIPVGKYVAALRLDGTFDGPEQRQNIDVKPGATQKLSADFATGVLEVRIASGGRRAAGMAVIKRNGQQLGTLGSGVTAHLSAGTYRILVRYRSHEKDLGDVTIASGQRLSLDATFE
jgi:hypothetical protein